MASHFRPAALRFLRGLKRHNERPWFDERKHVYEEELKVPMLAVIGEINHAFESIAPAHVRPAHKCLMRIYRDTRFSNNKLPYKTQVAAWWSREGLEKTSGGGFYFHLSATELHIAAGVYMPEREQLLSIRTWLVEHHAEVETAFAERKLRALMAPIDGLKLTRPPRGFAADSPELVMQKQWGVECTLPAETALGPGLVGELVKRFGLAAPLVGLLNGPLLPVGRKVIF